MLNTLLLSPLYGILVLLILPRFDVEEATVRSIKFIGILTASFCFFYSLIICTKYDTTLVGFQLMEELYWLSMYMDTRFLVIDGISLIFLILTTFTMLLVILSIANNKVLQKHRFYKFYFISLLSIEFFFIRRFFSCRYTIFLFVF